MPDVRLVHIKDCRVRNGYYLSATDKNWGTKNQEEAKIRSLVETAGLHSGNIREHVNANSLLTFLCLLSLVRPGNPEYALNSQRSEGKHSPERALSLNSIATGNNITPNLVNVQRESEASRKLFSSTSVNAMSINNSTAHALITPKLIPSLLKETITELGGSLYTFIAGVELVKIKGAEAYSLKEKKYSWKKKENIDGPKLLYKKDLERVKRETSDHAASVGSLYTGQENGEEVEVVNVFGNIENLSKDEYVIENGTKPYDIIKTGQLALTNYYEHYYAKYPDLKQLARNILINKIKDKFKLDVDPELVDFIHFNVVSYDSNGKVQYQPRIVRTLLQCLFENFDSAIQNNLQDMDAMCGIYNSSQRHNVKFHSTESLNIKPTEFIQLIWDIDFYRYALTIFTEYLSHKDEHIKKIFIDFINHLDMSQIDNLAATDVLGAVGLLDNDNASAALFDINEYKAANAFVFKNKVNSRVTLYFPWSDFKFISFSNDFEMRSWVANTCLTQEHRDMIASHFAIATRQDGYFYYGIDEWLKSIEQDSDNYDRIAVNPIKITPKYFFEEFFHQFKQRTLSDLNLIIKSNNEVRLKMLAELVYASNVIPNPVSLFLSLGFHIERAIDADTYEERMREWDAIKDNIRDWVVSVLLTGVSEEPDLNGYKFINRISEGARENNIDLYNPNDPIIPGTINYSAYYPNLKKYMDFTVVGKYKGNQILQHIDHETGHISGKYYYLNDKGEAVTFPVAFDKSIKNILTYGLGGKGSKQAAKQWKAKEDINSSKASSQLTPEEIEAIYNWGRTNSDIIYEFMANGMPEVFITREWSTDLLEQVNAIRSGIEKETPFIGQVFRGGMIDTPVWDTISKDSIVSNRAFMSTSVDREVAELFIPHDPSAIGRSILFIIKVNKSGFPIWKYTRRINEQEVLIKDNALFRVEEKLPERLVLKEVSRADLTEEQLNNVIYIDYLRFNPDAKS